MLEQELTVAEKKQLDTYRFNQPLFLKLQSELKHGHFAVERNWVRGNFKIPSDKDWLELTNDPQKHHHHEELARDAIRRGELCVVFLSGGMAMRYGHVVKAVQAALFNKSFLELKLRQLLKTCQELDSMIPVFLLTSFATHEKTLQHLEENNYFSWHKQLIHCVPQSISLRVLADGTLLRDEQGGVSFYAPGHGDVFASLVQDQKFDTWRTQGGKHVMVGNIDNFGASLSTEILGTHLSQKKTVSVEVTKRLAHDAGGVPVFVDNHLRLVEGFCFPPHVPLQTVSVFNTNTLWVNVEHFHNQHPLSWFRVEKVLGGNKVIQFEQLMGELTAFVDTSYICVPRTGPGGRFYPIKSPEDLKTCEQDLALHFAFLQS